VEAVELEREDPPVVTSGDDYTLDPTEGGGPGRPRSGATTLARRLGFVSAACGVALVTLVSYQLWGGDGDPPKAQDLSEVEGAGLLAEQQVVSVDGATGGLPSAVPIDAGAPDGPSQAGSAAGPADAPTPTPIGDSSRLPGPVDLVPRELLRFEEGSVVGRISIPSIDVEQLIVEGIDTESLTLGPGHYPTTSLPGLAGNAAVAGHRTTFGAPFNRIDELVPGDHIEVQMAWGEFTYEVVTDDASSAAGHRIVDPTDVWVLDDVGDNRLTLTSCHPEYSARQRIVVVARLVGEPASIEGST
jgi:sortase A